MKEPHTNDNIHLSPEDIAVFVEGAAGGFESARTSAHLSTCESCFEAYQYALRFAAGGAAEADGAPGQRAVRAAKRIAGGGHRRPHFDRRGARRWIASIGPHGRFGLAAAGFALFIAAVVWLRPVPVGEGFDPRSELYAPVTEAMIRTSERNVLVLPGVENRIGDDPAVYRSGAATTTADLDASLFRLSEDYWDEGVSADAAQWLISGYLATGQLDNARSYVEDARKRYPDETVFVALDAVVAYGENDLAKAAELLRSALEADPENVLYRFDLGVVLRESGDSSGARAAFERVREVAPNTPLAARAVAEARKILP